VLDEAGKTRIFDAALEVVSSVGMLVLHDEALALLRRAGCPEDNDGRVRLSTQLVEAALHTAPSRIAMYDREGQPAMDLGGYNSYFGTGSDLMYIYDLDSGDYRETRLDDVRRVARLCEALPSINFVMSSAHPKDEPPRISYLRSFEAMWTSTCKPLVVTAEGPHDLRIMWQAACALRGGEDELRARPYFIVYNEPVSPLQHIPEALGKLLFCADHGVPSIYIPSPLSGGTAPVTIAGLLVQSVAESLFGLVIHQLRSEGAPFIFGAAPLVLDLATAQSRYAAVEFFLGQTALVELARWLELPNWGYGGLSDSHVLDAQAGLELAEITLLGMLAGSNLTHDVGYLGFGLTGSLEEIVVADEFISMNRRLLRGIDIDDDSLAVAVIADVGPGGEFLSHDHTARNHRRERWQPSILNRLSRIEWERVGSPDLRERARQKATHILETSSCAPVRPEVAAQLSEAIAAFESAGQMV
jgi:trimethylamine--corrinoid protein Co-methyltransferase